MIRKTGTTIVGLRFKAGVALFADTRSTMGDLVEDKNCYKFHKLADTIYCAGAGTAADTEHLTQSCATVLSLFRGKYGREPFTLTARQFLTDHLYRHQGEICAALILAGVDESGAYLFNIHPHGSYSASPFTSLGSGSLAAMSILESGFKAEMSEEEAVALGVSAVEAGVLNDLYSGSNVDYLVIDNNGTRLFRNAKVVCRKEALAGFRYPSDSVKISKEEVFNFVEEVFE